MRISPRTTRSFRALATVGACALFLVTFSLFGWKEIFDSPDSGWILKTGEYILNHGSLPQHDLYSWTCPNRHWVVYQWLFEVIQAAILKLGNLWLVGLTTYVCAGIILLYLLPRHWLKLGVPAWVTFAMLTLCINSPWFFLRPQLASFLLINVWLTVLERYRNGRSKREIWLLPPFMVLWVNVHSFWLIGLLVLFCYAICAKAGDRQLWSVLFASATAVLINPYGIESITYSLSFITEADRGIAELRPPFVIHTPECYAFLGYISLCWILLLANRKKIPAVGWLVAAPASIAALTMARFMPVAILLTWPYLGMALSKVGSSRRAAAEPGSYMNSGYAVFAQLVLAIGLPCIIWIRAIPSQHAAAELFTAWQLEGIHFLSQHGVSDERLYNDERLGSRLLFFDTASVFIDNRFDMYGKQFCQKWFVVHYADPGWKQYLQEYGVTAIAISEAEPLRSALMTDPAWLLTYDDGRVSYWLSDTVRHRKQIAGWNLSPARIAFSQLPSPALKGTIDALYAKHHATGLAFLNAKNTDAALIEFEDAAILYPDSADAHHWLIHTLAIAGNQPRLLQELIAARPFFWRFPGESGGPANSVRQYTSTEKARIDAWAADACRQLLSKYGQTHKGLMH